jgi:hypothetical protein
MHLIETLLSDHWGHFKTLAVDIIMEALMQLFKGSLDILSKLISAVKEYFAADGE